MPEALLLVAYSVFCHLTLPFAAACINYDRAAQIVSEIAESMWYGGLLGLPSQNVDPCRSARVNKSTTYALWRVSRR